MGSETIPLFQEANVLQPTQSGDGLQLAATGFGPLQHFGLPSPCGSASASCAPAFVGLSTPFACGGPLPTQQEATFLQQPLQAGMVGFAPSLGVPLQYFSQGGVAMPLQPAVLSAGTDGHLLGVHAAMQTSLPQPLQMLQGGTLGLPQAQQAAPFNSDLVRQAAFLKSVQEASGSSQKLMDAAKASRERAAQLLKTAEAMKNKRREMFMTPVAAEPTATSQVATASQDVASATQVAVDQNILPIGAQGALAPVSAAAALAAVLAQGVSGQAGVAPILGRVPQALHGSTGCAATSAIAGDASKDIRSPSASSASTWKVVSEEPVNVRSEMSVASALLAQKQFGDMVRGQLMGDWLQLMDEPGFVVTVGAATRKRLLERYEPPVERNTPGGSPEPVAVWRVISGDPINVRQERSVQSTLLGTRSPGDHLRGREVSGWVQLEGELGYIVICGATTGEPLLARCGEDVVAEQGGITTTASPLGQGGSVEGTSTANFVDSLYRTTSDELAALGDNKAFGLQGGPCGHSSVDLPGVKIAQGSGDDDRSSQAKNTPDWLQHVKQVKSNVTASLKKARVTAQAASMQTVALAAQAQVPISQARASQEAQGPDRNDKPREAAPALGELRAPTGVRAAVAIVQHEAMAAAIGADTAAQQGTAGQRRRRQRSPTPPSRSQPRSQSQRRSGSQRNHSSRSRSPRPGARRRAFSDRPQAPDMSWAKTAQAPAEGGQLSKAEGAGPSARSSHDIPEWLRDLEMPTASFSAEARASAQPPGKKYIRMPDLYIKTLVGKGGETIRSAIEHSGAIIRVESGPRDPVGIVSITGNVQQGESRIREALRAKGLELPEMNGLVVNEVQGGNQSAVRRDDIQIPSELVKHFVGNKGSNIKILEEAAGGSVSIKVLPMTMAGGFQRIQVTGVHRATAEPLVMRRIEELKRCTGAGYGNHGNAQR